MIPADLSLSVQQALAEDIGSGDLTAALIPAATQLRAQILSREAGILCGQGYAETTFAALSSTIQMHWQIAEGASVAPDQILCILEGPARALLSGERTALNFLQTLSGTATQVRAYVDALSGHKTRLLDTRKTIPGLRQAQKYAVRIGGGHNHRLGLYDGILIKENHIAACGSITAALQAARQIAPALTRIEVEVENLLQLEEALTAGTDMVLLDNFPLEDLRHAVQRVAGRLPLEASGNIGVHNIAAVAATGVDFISVGSLTRNLRSLDLSLRYL
ncbi:MULTISPECIES: carboxylating nicotinate-nucleotide diphosphorylase [Acidithiobacillus]|jgi:nicotinate-nucleotide pyrophosphorylase (carboxylating)|uniref:nicotinate-nucleotide diphosphorylase (carboxylating) n=2 Tax=Acidithiobacillus TaxID=119977 RepID=A0ABU6FST3_9PROT|nr:MULTISPECIES: carboxylating nicotinate-nucleotide diphosphorylase [Acidithiobacillus]MBU2826933.1 carboxylating nicotinate-nucleotide diphosphorylase [Acidithiobacillus ferriphilus]MBU2831128.1 carboxylating nicotinate-nucleotide diphosphorylase [Acidithiobacillus ferriphilus]MBU2832673.1 carboxylating nicotinate-nucleotide diphosphorylase [Acidithiobacillus ferriphilus]MBU2847457.1 carboxylating nicotinate-nucleotide diphosphorylase [Acidithiobacillus ferriphilus]MBU2852658.1 carboxylating